jgi:branched-chain amino acid transport system substrate-binding protein
LEADTSAVLKTIGATALGSVRYPAVTTDHSSYLLQAQASGAKVIAIAGSGTTFVAAVKSAHEFGLSEGGKHIIVGLLVWLSDIKALGLDVAQGMTLTNAFYWDRDEATRRFAGRYNARMGRMPQMGDAADYSATMHYLAAVKAAGTDAAQPVMQKMRETPVNDFFAHDGIIRATIPASDAFRPLSDSTCPLVKKG